MPEIIVAPDVTQSPDNNGSISTAIDWDGLAKELARTRGCCVEVATDWIAIRRHFLGDLWAREHIGMALLVHRARSYRA